jgi:predicted nucleotidyltransferase
MVQLKPAITSLAEHQVEFVIVGGVAIRLHSSAYITQDLDFCYSRSNDNIRKLAAALSPFNPRPRNFPTDLPYIFDETTLRNGTNFTFATLIGDIDLLGELKGVGDYSDVIEHSIEFEIYGHMIKALSLDALIVSKTAAGRPKDQLVLPELKALREALDPDTD